MNTKNQPNPSKIAAFGMLTKHHLIHSATIHPRIPLPNGCGMIMKYPLGKEWNNPILLYFFNQFGHQLFFFLESIFSRFLGFSEIF
jgi:hypothetical protein